MARLPTVEIVDPENPASYRVINESDYDPDRHTLWEGGAAEIDATDSARKLAQEHGIDLATVEGTGKDGRVVKSDVEALIGGEQ